MPEQCQEHSWWFVDKEKEKKGISLFFFCCPECGAVKTVRFNKFGNRSEETDQPSARSERE